MKLQFEATEDGNILWGADGETMSIMCLVEVPEGASDDYGYLTMKSAILDNLTEAEKESTTFWYDGQEQYLEADASAGDVAMLSILRG